MWRYFRRPQSSDLLPVANRLHSDSSEPLQRLLATVQRLELECESLRRAQAEMSEQLSLSAMAKAAAEPMRAPRGQAGGRVRAQRAWRYSDGTFMPESERIAAIEDAALVKYERYAAGGRARAHSAGRFSDGTFAPRCSK
jgi:hypothetical protein